MTESDLAAAAIDALLARSGQSLLVLVDDRLRVARAGAEAAALAERPVAELAGMSLIAAFGSVALDAVAREALSSGEIRTAESELGRPGSRVFAIEAVPLPRDGLILALYDITAQRRAERTRRDFVANISHELRTPLASVKLLAETLSAGAVDDAATARDFTLQIEREVDHLAQLVDELLDLSTIESGQLQLAMEPLAPRTVVASVVERIGPVAERRGTVVRMLPEPAGDEDVHVRADAHRLGQALLNLAHNAVKYSHPSGEVRIGWVARETGVRFMVADDGIGIPEAHRERIFERFYKVDRSRAREAAEDTGGGSAGLGLAIVRHIAEAHGGRVGVDSSEGVGSTFWIELPRA